MFAEEAAGEWQKRSVEWEREQQARETLMKQVLEERAGQIEERFAQIDAIKQESLVHREALIADMERTHALASRERERVERAKVERRSELEGAVTTRK